MVKKDSAISRIKKACVSRWESAMAGLWSFGFSTWITGCRKDEYERT
jgi:hypothetical protein